MAKTAKKGKVKVLSAKEIYWMRRRDGRRGQSGPKPSKHGYRHFGEDKTDRRLTRKALLNNTKRARKLAMELDAEGELYI